MKPSLIPSFKRGRVDMQPKAGIGRERVGEAMWASDVQVFLDIVDGSLFQSFGLDDFDVFGMA